MQGLEVSGVYSIYLCFSDRDSCPLPITGTLWSHAACCFAGMSNCKSKGLHGSAGKGACAGGVVQMMPQARLQAVVCGETLSSGATAKSVVEGEKMQLKN